MPDDGITGPAATAAFLTWAEQTGLPADEQTVAQALDPDANGPEHLFTLLLQATAIAPPPPTAG